MNLTERFERLEATPTETRERSWKEVLPELVPDDTDVYHEVKIQVHDRLISSLDLSMIEKLSRDIVNAQIAKQVEAILREDFSTTPLNSAERQMLILEVQDEVFGLGPIEPFLKDHTVNDILVNTYQKIYVERRGLLELTSSRFKDEEHLRKIVDRIVAKIGRRIDESSPMVDARLMDGSRVNAIIPPLAVDGCALSIRKFSKDPLELADLIGFRSVTPELGELFKAMIQGHLNVIISGGTGSGKTTLLNVLSRFIPERERIVTIEDAVELQLKQEHLIRLETRPSNIEGKGEVTQRELVKNALRMRPDRIIVGEVRSSEALDMLQAMNTGHDGSLTTIHANTPRDALMRLETMVSMAGLGLDTLSMRRFTSSAIDAVIQTARLTDGSRKVISVQEITGMEGDTVTMQEIYRFKQHGIDPQGIIVGDFEPMGIRPKFMEQLHAYGQELSSNIFRPAETF